MSNETVDRAAAQPEPQATAGQMLRAAREATGLHVAALAVSMKVPVKKLEALEADRLGDLPDAVFVRALAASMCRTLKIDPVPILSKLPQVATRQFDNNDRGINAPFHSQGPVDLGSLKSFIFKPASLAVVGLLLAALAVVFVPRSPMGTQSGEASVADAVPATVPVVESQDSAVPAGTATAPATSFATAPSATTTTAAATATTTATATDPLAGGEGGKTVQGVTPGAAPLAANGAAVEAKPAAAAAQGQTGNGLVTFKATGPSWVRVTDSKGVVQMEKSLVAGDSVSSAGATPLSVVVGNVEATEVEVRGQPFVLDAFSKNNVARFEVK